MTIKRPMQLATALISSTILLSSFSVNAETLKYATSAPANSPWEKIITAFVDNASTKTDGSVTIKPYMGGQLGDEPTVVQQIARGRIDLGGLSLTAVALVVPELGLLNAPFLWDSTEQAECALDQHLIKSLAPYFEKRGLVNVSWGETGYQTVFSKAPLLKAEDYDGLKLRVAPSKGSVIGFKAVGANGVVLPPFDINASLQTGLIDAAEINITFGVLTGVGQLAGHVNKTNHIYLPSMTVMSLKSFNKLSDSEKEAVLNSSLPPEKQREILRSVESSLVEKLTATGGEVHELATEEREKLKVKMSSTWDELVKETGNESATVWQIIMDAKTACTS